MVALTTRQSNLLRYLLNHNTPAVIAEVGRAMGLTPRQVSYSLKPVKKWLATHNVTLKTTPGAGIHLECTLAQRIELIQELNAQGDFRLILNSEQRRQFIIFDLLTAVDPLILSNLQTNVQVSRTTILKDLEPVENWLQNFNLTLTRRPNYGINTDGPELFKRQALAALLWGETPFGKPLFNVTYDQGIVFTLSEHIDALPAVQQVNHYLSVWDTKSSMAWVTGAEAQLGGRFADDEVLHLALALAIQKQRVQAGQIIECDPDNLDWLQKQSIWSIAATIAQQLHPNLQPNALTQETSATTMYLLAGTRIDTWPNDLEIASQFSELITIFIEEAAQAFNAPGFRQDKSLRDGLTAHIVPACLRQRFQLWGPPSPVDAESMPDRYEGTQAIVQELANVITDRTGIKLPDDELSNIALLFRAAFIRERPNRRVKVFVVCPSGMATAQLLVARLKIRFPRLEVLGVLSVRQLTPESVMAAQLVISTVPLDFHQLGTQVIQVHPLLLPEDIDSITHWIT